MSGSYIYIPGSHTLHRRHQQPVSARHATILFSGFGGRKGPSSMGTISTAGVLRLRATSAVSPDKSVRRYAQDDDFVGIWTKTILNKLALMGLRPGLKFSRPSGTRFRNGRSHANSKSLNSPDCCGTAEAVPFVHQHKRKLVAISTAAHQQKPPILLSKALFKAVNKLHRQRAD
jgi:hypothetical protein